MLLIEQTTLPDKRFPCVLRSKTYNRAKCSFVQAEYWKSFIRFEGVACIMEVCAIVYSQLLYATEGLARQPMFEI